MRLTHLVSSSGCASKLGATQLTDILKQLPKSVHPSLLVGFDHKDDAGVFLLPNGQALVQTVDFFTPIVDDPYSYGAIAAANALSDIYAMGGTPITALNMFCFKPELAPPEVWAQILLGAHDKTTEAGAVLVGGHSVEDKEPKFGMAVTGLVDPGKIFANTNAEPGDNIYLTKPLGTGIITTAAKNDACPPEALAAAIKSMTTLNNEASLWGHEAGVRCATDITGFGLAGHLLNVARGSGVTIEIDALSLPLLPNIIELIEADWTTGGALKNKAYLGDDLAISPNLPSWVQHLVLDPQTSGGLALFSKVNIPQAVKIGRVVEGPVKIMVQ
ncbi:MAG TPA: selenide, water dikinase SelD [Fimbriimonadaceae bacterium]|jgi:selenide,water dikinase